MRDAERVQFFRPWANDSADEGQEDEEDDRRSVASDSHDSESSDGSFSLGGADSDESSLAYPGVGGCCCCFGLEHNHNRPDFAGHRAYAGMPLAPCRLPCFPGLEGGWPAAAAAANAQPYDEYANWMADYREALRRHGCQEAAAAVKHQQKKNRPKKFKCQVCNTAFSNNGQLKGHLRIHTGERPFRCDNFGCGKSFTRNEELTRHKRIHTGLRPYACAICEKRFGRKDHLKKHVRTHGREVMRFAHQEFFAFAPFVHPY